jgi:hypothetical protein
MHLSGSSGTSVYLSLNTSIKLIFLIMFSSIFLSSSHQEFVRRHALLVTRHAGEVQVKLLNFLLNCGRQRAAQNLSGRTWLAF